MEPLSANPSPNINSPATGKWANVLALAAMPVMLLLVEIGGVILAAPMIKSGYAVFEDPTSLENPVWFIGMLLGFTVILLILLKYRLKRVMQFVIWASLFLSFIYVFTGLLSLVGVDISIIATGGLILALAATLLLVRYPEWYVVDILGVLLSAGVASIFGISLEPIPVILLLVLLAVYDAISVYRTKHMLTLAEGIIENRMPIMVVVPKRGGYSFIKEGIGGTITGSEKSDQSSVASPEGQDQKQDRSAYLMGLGDLIMPAILVVSAAVFLPGKGMLGLLPAVLAQLRSRRRLATKKIVTCIVLPHHIHRKN